MIDISISDPLKPSKQKEEEKKICIKHSIFTHLLESLTYHQLNILWAYSTFFFAEYKNVFPSQKYICSKSGVKSRKTVYRTLKKFKNLIFTYYQRRNKNKFSTNDVQMKKEITEVIRIFSKLGIFKMHDRSRERWKKYFKKQMKKIKKSFEIHGNLYKVLKDLWINKNNKNWSRILSPGVSHVNATSLLYIKYNNTYTGMKTVTSFKKKKFDPGRLGRKKYIEQKFEQIPKMKLEKKDAWHFSRYSEFIFVGAFEKLLFWLKHNQISRIKSFPKFFQKLINMSKK